VLRHLLAGAAYGAASHNHIDPTLLREASGHREALQALVGADHRIADVTALRLPSGSTVLVCPTVGAFLR